ncbi:MAG: hypothetical protein APF83_01805 [Lutibacter sp. BRH_c52]|nr:MAG: hypothetical protein APF83_01805 [Lutibacter sp. BRH_c52]
MRLTKLILLGLLIFSCKSKQTIKEQPEKIFDIQSGYEIQKMTKNGIEFNFVVNKYSDTLKTWTTDPEFKTPEGYKIGTKLNEIPQTQQNKIYKLSGFGYFINLNSEWRLAFCEGKTCTDNSPDLNSIVQWIEKK